MEDENMTLMSGKDVAGTLKMHSKSFYRFLRGPGGKDFPASVRFGKRTRRWRRADIMKWIVDHMDAAKPAPQDPAEEGGSAE